MSTTVAPPGALVRRRPLAAYWLLAFGISWSYWVPLAVLSPGTTHFPGLLGPLLAAVVVTAATGGVAGLRELLGRLLRWRLPVRLWAAAAVPPAVAVAAVVLLAPLGRGLPSIEALSEMPGLPALGWIGVFLLVLLVNGLGEEGGWRGYAWPRLRARHGMPVAAVLLAAPWAAWHLPTFWLDTGLRGFPLLTVPGWLIGLTAGCVVLGWLYETGRSSLLLVAVFHAGLNLASATPATEGLPAAAVSAVVIAWAVCVLRSPASRLPRSAGEG